MDLQKYLSVQMWNTVKCLCRLPLPLVCRCVVCGSQGRQLIMKKESTEIYKD